MQTLSCDTCGYSICEDDYILCECPVCDSFLELNKIEKRLYPQFDSLRINTIIKLGEKAQ